MIQAHLHRAAGATPGTGRHRTILRHGACEILAWPGPIARHHRCHRLTRAPHERAWYAGVRVEARRDQTMRLDADGRRVRVTIVPGRGKTLHAGASVRCALRTHRALSGHQGALVTRVSAHAQDHGEDVVQRRTSRLPDRTRGAGRRRNYG